MNMKRIRKFIPHLCLSLALATLTFLVLYHFNPGIFVTFYFQIVLLLFCLAAIVSSIMLIISDKRNYRRK
jgi:hypothetical protein